MEFFIRFIDNANELLATLLVFGIGMVIPVAVALIVMDIAQSQDAIRRNYPLIGRFRGLFEHLGEFFRQYFFAMDREEMPFNRHYRNWVHRAAMDMDNTVAFGSTRDLRQPGTLLFINGPFPTLDESAVETRPIVLGPYCKYPYETNSLFNISAMSFGAISAPAVRALSSGAAIAGCWLNTGEGGLSPYHLDGGCDLVYQIGTAKYGVRNDRNKLSDERLAEIAAHENVRMFEVKLSQGAKPGKGGILPGAKVTDEIAAIRGIPAGRDSLSPNRDPDLATIDDILERIAHIRRVTGKPVGFKTVVGSKSWLRRLFETCLERGIEHAPDFIAIDGAEGGTGAAPMGLIDYMGLPIAESLPLTVDMLVQLGLKDRIKVIASGKLITPPDIVWALCVGADFVASARGFMFSLGCIQALQCNKDTCPTGITTHNRRLQRGLVVTRKARRVAAYVDNVLKGVHLISHSCGVREPRELNRAHYRVVLPNGRSQPLDELYPLPRPDSPVPAALADALARRG